VQNEANVCPNYASFSREHKMHFWVHVFASVADVESSCDTTKHAKGPNDWADGLFQVERSARVRKKSGRDPVYCSPNAPANTKDPKFNIECTVAEFVKHQCVNLQLDRLFYEGSYFQELRRTKNSPIRANIASYPGCHTNWP